MHFSCASHNPLEVQINLSILLLAVVAPLVQIYTMMQDLSELLSSIELDRGRFDSLVL